MTSSQLAKIRAVAISNLVIGMFLTIGLLIATSVAVSGNPVLCMVVFLFCLGIFWWRIHRVFQVAS